MNGDDDHVENAIPARDSKLVVALLTIQTALLMMLLLGGYTAYRRLDHRADSIDAVVSLVENPSQLLDRPELVRSIVTLMQNSTSAFFFGDEFGSIPSFVNNVMTWDFGALGSVTELFAHKVEDAFLTIGNSSLCSNWIQCNQDEQVQCADGRVRWCDWSGQVNCATDQQCLASGIATGASLVRSVAERLSTWKPVASQQEGPAAFSNGVFRLDVLLNWVETQMNGPKWAAMSNTCVQFVSEVKAINWNGTFVNGDMQEQSWDATRRVHEISDYLLQVCDGLQDVGADMMSTKHGSAKQQPKKRVHPLLRAPHLRKH